MKTHQLTLATLLLTFFLTSNSKAQIIDSLAIIPANPTTADTIKVISYTVHGYSSCQLTSSTFNINNDTINVYTSHKLGMLAAICYSIDTLTIGQLSAGTYEVHYHLSNTYPPPTYDIDTIKFTVQQASGLGLIDNLEKVKIYPTPTTTEINIDLKTQSTQRHDINFYSVLGQKVKTIKDCNDIITIDISDLTDGIYFIVITGENNKQWTRKIIKNNR